MKKSLKLILIVGVGVLVGGYIAVAQSNTGATPSAEVDLGAGPELGMCSDPTCQDFDSCTSQCDGTWSGVVTVNPSQVEAGDSLTVSLHATDPSGVQSAFARVMSPTGDLVDTITLFDDGSHFDSAAGDGMFGNTWTVADIADGQYTLDVTLKDRLNNESVVDEVGFFVIGEPPCTSNADCDVGFICCTGSGICTVNSCETNADCDDGDISTSDVCDSGVCPKYCINEPITDCINGDGYCPAGCDATNDDNCTDTTPPEMTFIQPANGAEITTDTVDVKVSATDPESDISEVNFFYNGDLMDTQVAPGSDTYYTWIWDLTGIPNGNAIIEAWGYNSDSVGLYTVIEIEVTINRTTTNEVPVVTITSPTGGQTVTGTVTVTVEATDDSSVQEVRLFHTNAGQLGTQSVTGTPVTANFSWNADATVTAYVDSALNQYAYTSYEEEDNGFSLISVALAATTTTCDTCTGTDYVNQTLYARAYDDVNEYGQSANVTYVTPVTYTYDCNCTTTNSGSSSSSSSL